jgi:thioredoxin 1
MKKLVVLFSLVCSVVFCSASSQSIANVDVIQVTERNFNQIERSTKPVVLDINASWCGACKMMSPIIDELNDEYNGSVIFAKIDVDTQHALSEKYNVTGLPTIVFLKPGQNTPVYKTVGAISKEEMKEKIDALFN